MPPHAPPLAALRRGLRRRARRCVLARGARRPRRAERRPTCGRAAPNASTDGAHPRAAGAVRAAPGSADALDRCSAGAYLQKVRETGDAALLHARRRRPATARSRCAPRDAGALTGAARSRSSRHDFRGGLRDALARPRAGADRRRSPFGAVVDAAGRARPLRRRPSARCRRWSTASPTSPPTRACPTCASCTATSPARSAAMRAGGVGRRRGARERRLRAQTLLGDLELAARPHRRRARAPYREALRAVPGYAAAEAGLARLDAARGRAGAGDRAACARRRRGCRCPSTSSGSARPSWPPGAARGARRDLALVRRRGDAAAARAGVNTDVELALFEADHGSPARAVALGAPGLGGGAERALGRRARLGAAPAPGARAPGSRGRGARWRLGSRDPRLPRPRRADRARRRASRAVAAPPAGARARSRPRRAGRRPAGGAAMRRALLRRRAALALAGVARRARGRAPARQLLGQPPDRRARVSSDRVDVRYILDQAEIPTFQERGLSPARGARAQARRGGARRDR